MTEEHSRSKFRILSAPTGAAVACATALWILISTAVAIAWYARPDVPYMDMWEFVGEVSEFRAGNYGLGDYLEQHNEHRLILPKLLFFAEFIFWGGTGWFLVGSILVIQALHAGVMVNASDRRSDRLWILALAAGLLFSLTQQNNLMFGFQVQFVGVYAMATAGFYFLSAGANRGGKGLIAGICCGLACSATMVNGSLFWPLAVLLAFLARRRDLLPIIIVGSLVTAVLLTNFSPVPGHASGSWSERPWAIVEFFLTYLGGALRNYGATTALVLGCIGVVLVSFQAVHVFRRRRSKPADTLELVWFHAALFVLVSAAATSVGRSGMAEDSGLALSGRYATPQLIFWVAVLSWWCARPGNRKWIGRTGVLSLLALLGWSQCEEIEIARERAMRLDVVAANLFTDAQDLGVLQQIYPWPSDLRDEIQFMRDERLGLFSRPAAEMMGQQLDASFEIRSDRPCRGVLLHRDPLDGAVGFWHAYGFVIDPEHDRTADMVFLVDPNLKIIGLAFARGRSSLAVPAMPQALAGNGWDGFIQLPENHADVIVTPFAVFAHEPGVARPLKY